MSVLVGDEASRQAQDDGVYGKIYWRMLPLLFLCYMVAYLDRVNVGFAKLEMLPALHFSEAAYGLGAGMFFIGYLIFEVPSNLILRRVGAARWIARIMVTWGVVSACTLFVRTPMQFYLARFALGVAEAGFAPGILYLSTVWLPDRYRGRAIAVYAMGAPISFVVGAPISGWILNAFRGSHVFQAWQWLFLIEAIPAIVLGVIVFFVLKNDYRDVGWLTPAEKARITADLQAENIRKTDHRTVRAFLADRLLWRMVLIYFSLILGLYAMSFWLPSLIRRAGVADPFHIGLYSAVPNLVASLALYLSGRQSDLTGKRRLCFSATLALGAFGLVVAMATSGGPLMTTAALCVAAAGIFSSLSLFWMLPANIFVGASAAAAMAVINSLGNLGGFVSPYVVGWLTDATGDADYGIYVISIVMLVGAAATMVLPRRVDG